ncbi:VQ domain-containing protein [Dioscorea alata]|uniref:VQ domain-containing protein n=1 Tax=Dioscorea alata TaxID=55571 RepID=A0ACB7W8U8_DIOAL|nr:VQ domain-containing protein [Dioscorea alata]
MDSGNSGSLQSSSAGEDDYDFTGPNTGATTSIHAPTQPLPPPPSSSTSLFDTFAYFESFPRSPPPTAGNTTTTTTTTTSTTNPLLNLEPSWPRPLRPPFNPNSTTDITGFITPSSSSSTTPVQPLQPDPPSRVSKKRSRASRRAPTTVLTTDTSNFRAMVQEFTGIPTAPFSSSTSTTTSTSRSRLPRYDSPYLLRPFAHKPHPTSFLSSSSTSPLLDPPASTSSATVASSNQLSHDHHLSAGSMQNQVLNFQSLLQSPITNLPSFMTSNKSDQVNYGVTHSVVGQVGGNLSNLVGSSEAMHSACSEFHSEKASDAARPPRTQGMVDSWICSSD